MYCKDIHTDKIPTHEIKMNKKNVIHHTNMILRMGRVLRHGDHTHGLPAANFRPKARPARPVNIATGSTNGLSGGWGGRRRKVT